MKCCQDKVGPLYYFSETSKRIGIPFTNIETGPYDPGFIKVIKIGLQVMFGFQTINLHNNWYFYTPFLHFDSLPLSPK